MTSRVRTWLLLGAVLVAVALAASPALENELVWDDLYTIRDGAVIHDWANLPAVFAHRTLYVSVEEEARDPEAAAVDTWRPVTLTTFMWDSSLSGRDPLAYHVTNLLAHLTCVVLVFLLARRMLPEARRSLAPMAGAWLGLTPLLGEAHLWINGRSDLFCTLFGLGAILVWRRAVVDARRIASRVLLHGVAALLLLLGLLSKEVLVLTLPALLLFPSEEGRAPRGLGQRLADVAPLALVTALYLIARSAVLEGLRTGTSPQLAAALVRLPVLLLDGLWNVLVPTTVYVRSLDDDYRALGLPLMLALGVVALAVAGLLFRSRRRLRLLAWGALWFGCTLAPAAVIATMLWPGFGRYLYLPFAGLVIGLVDVLGMAFERAKGERARRLLRIAALAYLLALGLRLHLWAYDWRDEEALYGSMIEHAPGRAHGWGWLGMTRLEEGRAAEAIPLLERADRLAPHRPRYLAQLGRARWMAGDVQGALDAAATGIGRYELAPDFHLLAAEILRAPRPDLAREHLARCLEEAPGHPGCRALAR